MKLHLSRYRFADGCTIGKLGVDGVFECYTLEDKVREPFIKIAGETAIPAGTYKVIVNWSTRFNRMLPLLVDVPDFEGVRIHPGNTAADTHGCILVGQRADSDSVSLSRAAFDKLFPKIDHAYFDLHDVSIEITNDRAIPETRADV